MRATARLTAKLERTLAAYATGAGAACVGLLALSQSAEARIIYTPAHILIGPEGGELNLDLNHDGINDFLFDKSSSCDISGCFLVLKVIGRDGAIETQGLGEARALRAGAPIGPRKTFGTFELMAGFYSLTTGQPFYKGEWVNVRHRYLGLKFTINGQTHFGWSRLNVAIQGLNMKAVLTGYAYETKPNKPIVAGDTGAGAASLGHLALGAAGRKPSMATGH